MFCAYVIRSLKSRRFYIGYKRNLDIRLRQHEEGLNRSTRKRGPFQLVHKEFFDTPAEAMRREKQIKKYKGGQAFQDLMRESGVVV